MLYKQCKLKQSENIFTTSWIPEKFAKKDKLLSIKNDDGTWSPWVVVSVGGSQEDPPDVRMLTKGHRKMTGDSLPKKSES